MKLFISSDIEGTCGICDWDETRIAHPDYYNRFADQMTREVSAACQAALGSGRIDEVLVKDAHGTARNIRFEGLPRGVKLFRGWERRPCGMMAGVEECDVAAMTGYHSFAFGEGNPLSHTNNLQNQWVKLNGQLAELILVFDNAHEDGYIAGVRYVYNDSIEDTELAPIPRSVDAAAPAETATLNVDGQEVIVEGLNALQDGDEIRIVCNHYKPDGSFDSAYELDYPTFVVGKAPLKVSTQYLSDRDKQNAEAVYLFTDIYQQKYWTPVIPQ